MKTVSEVLLVVAVVLFLYAAALVDHSDDLWGNASVVAFVGLAVFAAAHHPLTRKS